MLFYYTISAGGMLFLFFFHYFRGALRGADTRHSRDGAPRLHAGGAQAKTRGDNRDAAAGAR